MTPEDYCREIEAYLCRKNDGHLIRIVGPSFERVRGWAEQGIPFKIACQGIDEYFVRYYAKGPRRRPVQIDFCDADVLDAFDAWRRSVGVRLPGTSDGGAESRKQRQSLPEHLRRVLERLTSLLAGSSIASADLRAAIDAAANEVAALSELPAPLRGEARTRVIKALSQLDKTLLAAARTTIDEAILRGLRSEAVEQLAAFRERLSPEAFEEAVNASIDRILRDRAQLPTISFE